MHSISNCYIITELGYFKFIFMFTSITKRLEFLRSYEILLVYLLFLCLFLLLPHEISINYWISFTMMNFWILYNTCIIYYFADHWVLWSYCRWISILLLYVHLNLTLGVRYELTIHFLIVWFSKHILEVLLCFSVWFSFHSLLC